MSQSHDAEGLRDVLRATRRGADFHPSPEELTAYHERRLTPESAATVQEHLGHCPRCAALVLDFARFKDVDPPSESASGDTAAAWRRQQGLLLERGLAMATTATGNVRWLWGVAAGLALASTMLAFWALSLRQELDQANLPAVNPPLVNLEPISEMRASSDSAELTFSPTAERGWLILNLAGELPFERFRVDFLDTDANVRWSRDGLERSESGNFRFEVTRETLPEGVFQVVLQGLSDGHADKVAEYVLHIRHES